MAMAGQVAAPARRRPRHTAIVMRTRLDTLGSMATTGWQWTRLAVLVVWLTVAGCRAVSKQGLSQRLASVTSWGWQSLPLWATMAKWKLPHTCVIACRQPGWPNPITVRAHSHHCTALPLTSHCPLLCHYRCHYHAHYHAHYRAHYHSILSHIHPTSNKRPQQAPRVTLPSTASACLDTQCIFTIHSLLTRPLTPGLTACRSPILACLSARSS